MLQPLVTAMFLLFAIFLLKREISSGSMVGGRGECEIDGGLHVCLGQGVSQGIWVC